MLKLGATARVGLLAITLTTPAMAAAPHAPIQVDAGSYNRAKAMMPGPLNPLVDHLVRRVTWLGADRFLFADHDARGDHYRVMEAATGNVSPAFDAGILAAALSKAKGQPVSADSLGIFRLDLLDDGRLDLRVRGGRFLCSHVGSPQPGSRTAGANAPGQCEKWTPPARPADGPQVGAASTSPDGRFAVFERDWNLWLRDLASGQERALTTDGVKDYGYATGNAGWVHNLGAIVRWSPDSSQVATYRQDQRKVGDMYTLKVGVGHPQLQAWKYALPGDAHVFMIEPLVIRIDTGAQVRLQMPPQFRTSTLCDKLACDDGESNRWSDVKWAADSKTLALVSTSRDRKHMRYQVANAATGTVRTVFEDRVATYYESGRGRVNWQYLPETNEAIWFSERSDWGNLYLHDLQTGKLKHAITRGPGNVAQVLRIDRKTRTLWFVGNARTPGLNPYYRQFYKVDLDTGRATLLTPEPADHKVSLSPDGRYFVDLYSTVAQPPVTVLRATDDGRVIATIARTDDARLQASGWKPPEEITVKARDGKTALYGLLFKPSNFDPTKKYPVVNYIYPGPQVGSVSSFDWEPARGDRQAMAELGFIVVSINGMGTPWRSKSFHDASYGDMGDNTLPDQVTAIQQLGQRHTWIDLDRVGIWGHSGGGYATATALFRYPEFFKVGWAESGNHDNRNYENDWGEKYHGLLVTRADGSSNYDNQANQLLAHRLKGHLMLVHGSADDNVPASGTELVVRALMKANKDFDLLMLPNARHIYLSDNMYVTRRRWDYFVRHLMGAQPPQEYKLEYSTDSLAD